MRARERAFGAIAGIALGCVAAACTVFTSLDGLTGGSPPDAASGVGLDAGGVDATGVVPGQDATLADAEAGASGEDASDASTPPFCASQSPAPTFCDDFDEDPDDAAALAAPWDQVTGTGGSVVRAGGIFTSPPLAMLATASSPVKESIDLAAYKAFTTVAKTGEFTLAFDVYVVAPDTTANSDAVLAAFELVGTLGERWASQLEVFYDPDGGGALDVDFSENRSPADAGGGYTSHPASQQLPVGAWTRVTMTTSYSGPGTGTVTLHLGTTEVAKATAIIPVLSGVPEILVGLTYAQASTQGWTVRYDDVTFQAP